MDKNLQQKLAEFIEKYYWYSETYIRNSKNIKYSRVILKDEDSTEYKDNTSEKDTSLSGRLKKYLDHIRERMEDTFSERVRRIIKKKGFSNVDIYKKANLDRKVFSKLINNKNYQPGRNTALALVIALELDEFEIDDLLGRAGFALSDGNKEDVIIRFFIINQLYDINVINEALVSYGLPILGERNIKNVASEETKDNH